MPVTHEVAGSSPVRVAILESQLLGKQRCLLNIWNLNGFEGRDLVFPPKMDSELVWFEPCLENKWNPKGFAVRFRRYPPCSSGLNGLGIASTWRKMQVRILS